VPDEYQDESGSRETLSLWLTWDTNSLYLAVQADVHGSLNEIIMLINTGSGNGITSFLSPPAGSMIEERHPITEGFSPDMILRMWCSQGSSFYGGTPARGSSELKFNINHGWSNVNLMLSTDPFYAWCNSDVQATASRRCSPARPPGSTFLPQLLQL